MQRERVQGVAVEPLFKLRQAAPLAAALQQRQWPSISALRGLAVGGGLMSCGPRRDDLWRRSDSMIDKMPNGAWPDALPVEEPTTFALVFNLYTVQALGLKLPQARLLRADDVVE